MQQATIQKSIHCGGIGLHSGKRVELRLDPAREDTGILFAVENGGESRSLRPGPEMVVDTGLATTLGHDDVQVSTVEHLLAAVYAMGIDNLRIRVSGGEVPIMDGSAGSFVYLLKQAGLRRQGKPRRTLEIKKPLFFEKGDKYIKAFPHDGLLVDYTIDFPHPLIGRQHLNLEVDRAGFEDVARARTFGFLREVEYLHANGLALGGSLDNAVVLDEYRIVNDGGLRFPDEFVRHKVLDFIGDIAVLNYPIRGRFEVFASGHKLNNDFLRYLWDNSEEYLRKADALPADTGRDRPLSGEEVAAPLPAPA